MKEKVDELARLSESLNRKSNQVNEIISTVNKKLLKLNIGIEVWLEDEYGNPRALETSESAVMTLEHTGESYVECREEILGYCRVDDEWQLAIRTDTVQSPEDSEAVRVEKSKRPLLKCSRSIRLKALQLLDDVLDEITQEIGVVLDDIDGAQAIADKL